MSQTQFGDTVNELLAEYNGSPITEDVAEAVAEAISSEVTFENVAIEDFHYDIEECIDDSGDWLLGRFEYEHGAHNVSVYLLGHATGIQLYVDRFQDPYWSEAMASSDAMSEFIRMYGNLVNDTEDTLVETATETGLSISLVGRDDNHGRFWIYPGDTNWEQETVAEWAETLLDEHATNDYGVDSSLIDGPVEVEVYDERL